MRYISTKKGVVRCTIIKGKPEIYVFVRGVDSLLARRPRPALFFSLTSLFTEEQLINFDSENFLVVVAS